MSSDTIVAPATPHGISGIAVVRLSGPSSITILHKLINNRGLNIAVEHGTAVFHKIFDEHSNLIDETVCTYFKMPNSYTSEDIVEISCHGNPIIVERIINTCSNYGARLAEPGEFTRRAFLNGKLDLVQAESVASLIHAKSEESRSLNLKLLSGELSKKLNSIRENLIALVASIEFELDISEDDLQPKLIKDTALTLKELINQSDNLLNSYKQARLLNNGALVVIAGKPNVGKSTLLNALTESDRAITSALPGTTRDAIDVQLILDGVPISLIDTAGIRTSNEEIEQEGVKRSINYIKRADLVLSVYDISETKQNNIQIPPDIPVINIINKTDLANPENPILSIRDKLLISAKTGKGLEELKQQIKKSLSITSALTDTVSITTNRQYLALKSCNANLRAALELLESTSVSYELLSIEIREALESVGQILGKTTPDDILSNIFNHFCVGK